MTLSPEPSAAEATETEAPATKDPASAATRTIAATRFLTWVADAFIDGALPSCVAPASIRGALRAQSALTRSNRSIRTIAHIDYRQLTCRPIDRVDQFNDPRARTSHTGTDRVDIKSGELTHVPPQAHWQVEPSTNRTVNSDCERPTTSEASAATPRHFGVELRRFWVQQPEHLRSADRKQPTAATELAVGMVEMLTDGT